MVAACRPALPRALLLVAAWLALPAILLASSVTLKDGRRLDGSIGKVAKLAQNPTATGAQGPATITFVDDDLRRVFVPQTQIMAVNQVNVGDIKERITIKQNVALAGGRVNRLGPIVKITQFDDRGRRTFSMMTDKGQVDIIQGITQITPVWTKVEGLTTAKQAPLMCDMRLATSSIPRETLHAILSRAIDPKILEQRVRIVRLFLQQDRFLDAQIELEGIIADFPEREQLTNVLQDLRQLHARSIVKEIEVRRKVGQHLLAYSLLEQFPAEDVAGDILAQVSEMLDEYRSDQKKIAQILEELKTHAEGVVSPQMRTQCEAFVAELEKELSINTLERMASYLRLGADPGMTPEQKVALAATGWLLGSDQADTNLIIAMSLFKVRAIIERYLMEGVKNERAQLLKQLEGLEGASPKLVAGIIAHMKPPLASPDPSAATPGFYKLSVPIGLDNEPDARYLVQLPPQYDPLVRYPTIVTLNGGGTTPERQIDWWAGEQVETRMRMGQATRLGYIVVAVDWMKDGQREYEFSAREHAAVLGSLRDACRRFSIDTDRVFLTGHSLGGNAAWDIGLAHPDLWAGVMPIVAQCEKYCTLYSDNAGLVPMYVLGGELDGNKTVANAPHLERYFSKRFDITLVEYRGRGHEDFHDDILNLFDWMNRRPSRNFFPKEFTVVTMRPWDNYFWWLEGGKFPSKGMIDPANWPPGRGVRPIEIKGKQLATNGLSIASSMGQVTLWLSPEAVDFDRPMKLTLNNTSLTKSRRIDPDLSVLLEDVRTRGDRQHPFWAKVEH